MKEKENEQFAVVELMGHRKIAGAIKQSELAPGALIRVDAFGTDADADHARPTDRRADDTQAACVLLAWLMENGRR
ncbi:MAG: hypothetical protein M9893_13205 [Pyrinomonadaceae bacterium]|nr:hypothetical protein [Pyrinomonadaceae bacterium]